MTPFLLRAASNKLPKPTLSVDSVTVKCKSVGPFSVCDRSAVKYSISGIKKTTFPKFANLFLQWRKMGPANPSKDNNWQNQLRSSVECSNKSYSCTMDTSYWLESTGVYQLRSCVEADGYQTVCSSTVLLGAESSDKPPTGTISVDKELMDCTKAHLGSYGKGCIMPRLSVEGKDDKGISKMEIYMMEPLDDDILVETFLCAGKDQKSCDFSSEVGEFDSIRNYYAIIYGTEGNEIRTESVEVRVYFTIGSIDVTVMDNKTIYSKDDIIELTGKAKSDHILLSKLEIQTDYFDSEISGASKVLSEQSCVNNKDRFSCIVKKKIKDFSPCIYRLYIKAEDEIGRSNKEVFLIFIDDKNNQNRTEFIKLLLKSSD
ncbi:MAG: hypothetical protein COU81_02820 [Candidatus Portnoybacteria bacterium CG10_big_fil_rev_8_21_14_0_10_36_7]|uniref:Uncharacterized protein n=1 Tax=Candidatus Portnoybacteria bacterium CG10_big_fil_rev_8_21_14_0_10_36_7 TaxID=1974812 RepID=A0A2M8KDR0_9BACT|nr:MAG: hypothetical protein COU81_02820 [Candidatus Portnoybacteria bacterium CG10_big_fil_rev_8_21_14_0_10_36_7]